MFFIIILGIASILVVITFFIIDIYVIYTKYSITKLKIMRKERNKNT